MKQVDKKDDKVRRIVQFIVDMKIGSEAKITPMAKKVSIHPNTIRAKLDEFQTFSEIGKIGIIRDEEGKILRIVKEKEEKEHIKEIRERFNILDSRLDKLEKLIKI